jgi:hypothetical protein
MKASSMCVLAAGSAYSTIAATFPQKRQDHLGPAKQADLVAVAAGSRNR